MNTAVTAENLTAVNTVAVVMLVGTVAGWQAVEETVVMTAV